MHIQLINYGIACTDSWQVGTLQILIWCEICLVWSYGSYPWRWTLVGVWDLSIWLPRQISLTLAVTLLGWDEVGVLLDGLPLLLLSWGGIIRFWALIHFSFRSCSWRRLGSRGCRLSIYGGGRGGGVIFAWWCFRSCRWRLFLGLWRGGFLVIGRGRVGFVCWWLDGGLNLGEFLLWDSCFSLFCRLGYRFIWSLLDRSLFLAFISILSLFRSQGRHFFIVGFWNVESIFLLCLIRLLGSIYRIVRFQFPCLKCCSCCSCLHLIFLACRN